MALSDVKEILSPVAASRDQVIDGRIFGLTASQNLTLRELGMNRHTGRAIGLLILMFASAAIVWAQAPKKIYAQKLVADYLAAHKDVLVLGIHATKPGTTENRIIAINLPTHVGKKSDADDMKVINTGKPLTEAEKDEGKYEVLLPLQDRSGKQIGALAVVFPYHEGDDQTSFLPRAVRVRDQLASKIPSLRALFRPVE